MAASSKLTLQASGNQVASGSSAGLAVGLYTEVVFYLVCTLAAGTTPTLDVKIQTSPDQGVTWVDGPSFPQITAAVSKALTMGNGSANGGVGDFIRANWTIGGSAGPNFTFAVLAVAKL